MRRPPFDLMRAAFWLLVAIVAAQLINVMSGTLGCGVMVLLDRYPLGSCVDKGIIGQLREQWTEMFTAILALMLAAKKGPRE